MRDYACARTNGLSVNARGVCFLSVRALTGGGDLWIGGYPRERDQPPVGIAIHRGKCHDLRERLNYELLKRLSNFERELCAALSNHYISKEQVDPTPQYKM